MCKFCKELNEEKEKIRVDGIFIERAGYYKYDMPVIYCSVCGTMLDKYKGLTEYQLELIIET
jgi:hypothetical protein